MYVHRKKIISLSCFLVFVFTLSCCKDNNGKHEPQIVKTKSGIEMVKIPAGWFEMGNSGGLSDERPAHKVWVDSFYIDRFEVTQEQFRKLQIPDPSHFKNPNNPVEQVNWVDAATYCNERSKAEGFQPCYDEQTWDCNFQANGYRLPTEAEWEYACRAGTNTKYFFGNNSKGLKQYAWFSENSSDSTHPVGLKQPNPWGLYDIYGNVAEWCNDFYSIDYYSESPPKNPKGPVKTKEKVTRGGAWNLSADSCRSSYRSSDISLDDTCLADDAIGFRCIRNVTDANLKGQVMEKQVAASKKQQTAIVYDDIYLNHKTIPGHPDNPQRLTVIIKRLQEKNLYSHLLHLKPLLASLEWITSVHTAEYVERVRESCQKGEEYLDTVDVPISAQSYEVALKAAGGVLAAIDAVMAGRVTNAFCAVRPPGHHALKDKAMGFCIFNNIAIAARYIQTQYALERILIVDWDVHHGNGTQQAFYNDPNILYFSVHQYPFYPMSGSDDEKGLGKGFKYTINVPLPAGSNDLDYKKAFENELIPAALSFSPDFVLISAGFDAHQEDTLGGMKVTSKGFAELTRIVKQIAERCCQGRLVSVLEGGYNLENLADAVEAHMKVLMNSGN